MTLNRKIITALILVCAGELAHAQDANVLIGLSDPAYGIKIKNNLPGTGGFARAFMLSNQDASVDFIGLGARGQIVNGITSMDYGYIGPSYNKSFMAFTPAGNVGIGTTDPKGYKLAVAGNMIAESVKVKLQSAWPDYVFTKEYALPSLKETEKHIKETGHLPGIPSAAEVKSNGIDLGEMNAKLLKKIEEMTLYLIELKNENTQLNRRLTKVEKGENGN